MKSVEAFWNRYLKDRGLPEGTPYQDVFHFELSEYWANELLRLVLIGQKKATASALAEFSLEGRRVPEAGDLYILTDWSETPRCVVRVDRVTILPFREMTWDLCSKEGEDDSLASWRAGHRKFFSAEGHALGYQFSEDMPVVFEEFAVVYRETE